MPSPQQLSRRRRRKAAAGSRAAGSPTAGPPAADPIPAETSGSGAAAAPAAEAEDALAKKSGATAARAGQGRSWRSLLPPALGAATVALGGLAVWSGMEAHGLRSGAAAHNTALTDNARTSEAKGQITSAVNSLFSYNYADTAKTEQAAKRLLTGKAVGQYDQMFGPVRRQAAADKPVLTTTVTDSGVSMLQGDRARVLIFADQRNTRTAGDQTTHAGAMLAVDAVRQGGTWKISNFDTLNVPR
jgi:Mce-associated membrane protein